MEGVESSLKCHYSQVHFDFMAQSAGAAEYTDCNFAED